VMDAGVSGVPGWMSNSKAPNTCMDGSPFDLGNYTAAFSRL
jgi:hypothetical protein